MFKAWWDSRLSNSNHANIPIIQMNSNCHLSVTAVSSWTISLMKSGWLSMCQILSNLWFYCVMYQIKWNFVTGHHGGTVVILKVSWCESLMVGRDNSLDFLPLFMLYNYPSLPFSFLLNLIYSQIHMLFFTLSTLYWHFHRWSLYSFQLFPLLLHCMNIFEMEINDNDTKKNMRRSSQESQGMMLLTIRCTYKTKLSWVVRSQC